MVAGITCRCGCAKEAKGIASWRGLNGKELSSEKMPAPKVSVLKNANQLTPGEDNLSTAEGGRKWSQTSRELSRERQSMSFSGLKNTNQPISGPDSLSPDKGRRQSHTVLTISHLSVCLSSQRSTAV
jgi:hypothetical protein